VPGRLSVIFAVVGLVGVALAQGLFPVLQGYLAEAACFQGGGGARVRQGETLCESART
jgi:hypothetical protein